MSSPNKNNVLNPDVSQPSALVTTSSAARLGFTSVINQNPLRELEKFTLGTLNGGLVIVLGPGDSTAHGETEAWTHT